MHEDNVPDTCEHEVRTAADLKQANHLDGFIKVANNISIVYFSVICQNYYDENFLFKSIFSCLFLFQKNDHLLTHKLFCRLQAETFLNNGGLRQQLNVFDKKRP